MARKRKGTFTFPAATIERRPVEWLWKKHIPYAMISIIAGWPEKGKSMLATRIAADVSQEYPVIYSQREDHWAETMVPRLEAAGANMDNIHGWKRMLLPNDLRALRSEIEELGAMLVIMDPAASHTRNSIYNTSAIRDAFDPLEDIANETDAAFLMIHHLIKKVDLKADPLAALGGAGGGLNALVRCAYLFGDSPDDPDERLLVQLKCNIANRRQGLKFLMDVEEYDDDVEGAFLTYTGTHSYNAHKVFTAKASLNLEKLEHVAEYLIENLREGPMTVEAIMTGARDRGFTKRMTRSVAEQLEIVQKKNKWQLPREFPDDV